MVILGCFISWCKGDAPFCLVSSSGKRCIFYDANECKKYAFEEGGMCVVNDGNYQQQNPQVQPQPKPYVAPIQPPKQSIREVVEDVQAMQDAQTRSEILSYQRDKAENDYYNSLTPEQQQEYIRNKKVSEQRRAQEASNLTTVLLVILGITIVGVLVLVAVAPSP